MPNTDDFRQYLVKKIYTHKDTYVDVTSGDVHRALGGYPDKNHRMKTCCNVMYQLMKGDDTVLPPSPLKGNGASLTIRYFKHNHN